MTGLEKRKFKWNMIAVKIRIIFLKLFLKIMMQILMQNNMKNKYTAHHFKKIL